MIGAQRNLTGQIRATTCNSARVSSDVPPSRRSAVRPTVMNPMPRYWVT
jgi:hypothetical protein